MQQDTWNTRVKAPYASLGGLPIVNLSTFVLHSSRPKRMVSSENRETKRTYFSVTIPVWLSKLNTALDQSCFHVPSVCSLIIIKQMPTFCGEKPQAHRYMTAECDPTNIKILYSRRILKWINESATEKSGRLDKPGLNWLMVVVKLQIGWFYRFLDSSLSGMNVLQFLFISLVYKCLCYPFVD